MQTFQLFFCCCCCCHYSLPTSIVVDVEKLFLNSFSSSSWLDNIFFALLLFKLSSCMSAIYYYFYFSCHKEFQLFFFFAVGSLNFMCVIIISNYYFSPLSFTQHNFFLSHEKQFDLSTCVHNIWCTAVSIVKFISIERHKKGWKYLEKKNHHQYQYKCNAWM